MILEQRKRELSETVRVQCTDAHVLGSQCFETKPELGIVRTLILFENVNNTPHYLSHRLIFLRMEVVERPFRYLAA